MKLNFSESQIDQIVAEHLLPKVISGMVFLVKGPLGAGKTTLAKTLAKSLGVVDELTSPTFTYVNIYKKLHNSCGVEVFSHFDLYRLESFAELVNLDLFPLIGQSGSFCFIEWPELIEKNLEYFSSIKLCFLELEHDFSDSKKRILTFKSQVEP